MPSYVIDSYTSEIIEYFEPMCCGVPTCSTVDTQTRESGYFKFEYIDRTVMALVGVPLSLKQEIRVANWSNATFMVFVFLHQMYQIYTKCLQNMFTKHLHKFTPNEVFAV